MGFDFLFGFYLVLGSWFSDVIGAFYSFFFAAGSSLASCMMISCMTSFPFMAPKRIWKIIKCSFADFFANNVLKLSASLAFSTIFSLPGLLIIIIWISDLFYRREVVEGSLYGQMARFVGKDTAASIQQTMEHSLTGTGNH